MIFNLNIFCKRPIVAVFLILLAGITAYANTFQVPFILDDHLWITLNSVIKELENFLSNSSGYTTNPNRFIVSLTFALNYHWGGLDVTGYHIVNQVIHLITALLVYTLLRLTFHTPYFKRLDLSPQSSVLSPQCFIPLCAALLFVAHPVQTQAVTYLVQRMTSLATLFYLLSVLLYVQARLSIENAELKIKRSERKTASFSGLHLSRGVLLNYAGSVFSAILSMKSKEIAFTLPLAIVLFEMFFFRGPWKRRLLYLLPLLATLPIIPLTVIEIGGSGKEMISNVGVQLRVGETISRLDYLFTQFRVIITYLRLLILPVNQNLDYDYQVYTTFFTPPVYLSLFILVVIFALAAYLYFISRQASTNNHQSPNTDPDPAVRIISFGIFWFFLALSVESSIIPITDVIAEHRLYLPAFGAAAIFATIFYLIGKKITRLIDSRLFILGVTVLVMVLGFASFQRNQVWRDPIGLWRDVVSKSPNKARPYSNLGAALNKAGKPWEAIPVLSRALAIAPYFDRANFNLGRSYLLIGQSENAIPLLQKAIKENPDFNGAYNDLGAALIKVGRYDEAATLLEQNLKRLSRIPETRFNLGIAYYNLGNLEAAQQELEILARLDTKLATKLADFLAQ